MTAATAADEEAVDAGEADDHAAVIHGGYFYGDAQGGLEQGHNAAEGKNLGEKCLESKRSKIEVTRINLENHISGVGVRDPNGNYVEDDHEGGAEEEGGAAPLVISEGAEEEDTDDQPSRAGR